MISKHRDKAYIALTVIVIVIHAVCVYQWVCVRWERASPKPAEQKPYKVWQSGL